MFVVYTNANYQIAESWVTMNIAVIFAGGVGKRMQTGGLPKQFLEVEGVPILVHTLRVFQTHSRIDAIVLVMVSDWIDYANALITEYGLDKVVSVVPGGSTGQESIYNGLVVSKALVESRGEHADDTIVLLHDGVRPVIDHDTISANIEGVKANGSAITCVPCKETVVMVNEDGSRVIRIVEREKTRIAKAPQSFYLTDILAAHERARKLGRNDVIDSCTMMQLYGAVAPSVIEGTSSNIKVTTPEDYYTLQALLNLQSGKLRDL